MTAEHVDVLEYRLDEAEGGLRSVIISRRRLIIFP